MKRLFFILMLLTPLTAGAATYSWTDASGTMNFTDDLGTVPANYRKKALQKAAGENMAPEVPPSAEASETKAVTAPVTKSGSSDTPVEPKVTAATRFGERAAGEWQALFKELRAELASIEQKRETLKQESGDGKKFLTRQQINDINTRNKQLYDEYEAARVRFNALVEQANKVGLPSEFGQ